MSRILVIDDEASLREMLEIMFSQDHHDVQTAHSVKDAIQHIHAESWDLVLTDLRLPDGSGLDVLDAVTKASRATQVIMMTAFATAETALEAMRKGAYDYQIKPFKMDEMRVLAHKAIEKAQLIQDNQALSAQLRKGFGFAGMAGRSPPMMRLQNLIEKVAPSRANVLIRGESGTGKELVARAIHEASERAAGPFVPVNCGAIPDNLIEAELFGHAPGAFTGAARARGGLFEAAEGGTILLDEVGELPSQVQVKLLRVIQERCVRRVGEEEERPVDVRIVAATNRDLEAMVEEGTFRDDLYYRLNVVSLEVPPLRERREDIPLLANLFVRRFTDELDKKVDGIDARAMEALRRFKFPGNVRELQNYIERAVAFASGPTIQNEDLPDDVTQTAIRPESDNLFSEDGVDLEETLQGIERDLIAKALETSDGVKTKAAALLGLSFRSFRYRLKKLGLTSDDED